MGISQDNHEEKEQKYSLVTIRDSSLPAAVRSSFFTADCTAAGGTVRCT